MIGEKPKSLAEDIKKLHKNGVVVSVVDMDKPVAEIASVTEKEIQAKPEIDDAEGRFSGFEREFVDSLTPQEAKGITDLETFILSKINTDEKNSLNAAFNIIQKKNKKLAKRYSAYRLAERTKREVGDAQQLSVDSLEGNSGKITADDSVLVGEKGEEAKKVGDKIVLDQKQFEEKYKEVLGKNLYNKEGDLLIFNAENFDEKNSLVKILVQSKSKVVRINELDSLYLAEYKPEEKESEFEKIKKDIVLEIRKRKKKAVASIEKDIKNNNLCQLNDYLLHNNNIIYELGELFASLEDKLGGEKEDELFAFLEKEINASNEEIRKKFESLKSEKFERKNKVGELDGEMDESKKETRKVETPEQRLKRKRKEELRSFSDFGLTIQNSEEVKNINWEALGFNDERKRRASELSLENELSKLIKQSDFFPDKADRLAKMLAKKIIKDNL